MLRHRDKLPCAFLENISRQPLKFQRLLADEIFVTSIFDPSAQTALLNLPSTGSGSPKRSITCLFGGVEGKRLFLECQEKPPVSAALSVEYGDALFLGEVIHLVCRSGNSWQAEIRVEQVLSGLQSLMALRSRLLGENVRATVRPSISCPVPA